MKPKRKARQPQSTLTLEQQAAAKSAADSFDAACIQAHLSTEPVDEQAAEGYLRHAYAQAGQAAPRHIHWLDGPLPLVAILASERSWLRIEDSVRERLSPEVWNSLRDNTEIGCIEAGAPVLDSVDYRVTRIHTRPLIYGLNNRVWTAVRERVGERIWQAVAVEVNWPLSPWIRDSFWGNDDYAVWHSIRAYDQAPPLDVPQYLGSASGGHFAREQGHPLAHFNQMASGYWFGKDVALVVRKPRLLAFDDAGRLHSATGRCVEYPDGWGFYAWHGAPVPERVILDPDSLTREDFLGERNVESRRVIQERMGERFLWEVGGRFIDGGTAGVLYEVELPDDPDRVARYVQVADPSTGREYFLRVPPMISTAVEAVAWTFGLPVSEYRPAQES